MPILQTPRLLLRPVEERDAPALHLIRDSEYVLRYNAMQPMTAEKWLDCVRREGEQPGTFCMVLKETGIPIGMVYAGDDDLRYQVPARTLAYWMDEKQAGQGLMTEALRALMDYCFGSLGCEVVSARCFTPNLASRRVLEKLGMTREGCLRRAVRGWQGEVYDDCVYSLLREEWASQGKRGTSCDC